MNAVDKGPLVERLDRLAKRLIATTEFHPDAHTVLDAGIVLLKMQQELDSLRKSARGQVANLHDALGASLVSESALEVDTMRKERDALKRRLAAMMPLFQEARDALPAISLASAKLHGLDLTLGDRMDDVGVPERWKEREKREGHHGRDISVNLTSTKSNA